MERFGGSDAIGIYSEWRRNVDNYCIYCGSPATTREHIPSKVFLDEDEYDNLCTIPACFNCNNSFSDDEFYVAAYIETIKSKIVEDYKILSAVKRGIDRNEKLKEMLDYQINKTGSLDLTYDKETFATVIKKLAIGHAAYMLDYVEPATNSSVKYLISFGFCLDGKYEDDLVEFNENCIIPQRALPEAGCRACNNIGIFGNIIFFPWTHVQNERYRFNATYDADDHVIVKIVINEIFYAKVIFIE